MTYTKIEGAVADLIRTRAGKVGEVTIDEYLNGIGPGCETCGYGDEPDCEVTIYINDEVVFRVAGAETTFSAINDWLNQ